MFSKIPLDVRPHFKDMPPCTFKIYGYLCLIQNNVTGKCWPSYNELVEQCDVSRMTAIQAIKSLCALGLVVKEKVKSQGSKHFYNVYTVVNSAQNIAAEGGIIDGINGGINPSLTIRPDGTNGGITSLPITRVNYTKEIKREVYNLQEPSLEFLQSLFRKQGAPEGSAEEFFGRYKKRNWQDSRGKQVNASLETLETEVIWFTGQKLQERDGKPKTQADINRNIPGVVVT